MSEQILLLNPRRRRHNRRKKARRKHNRRRVSRRRHNRRPAALARWWAAHPGGPRRRRRSKKTTSGRSIRRKHNRRRRHNRHIRRFRMRHNRRSFRETFASVGGGRGVVKQFLIPGAIGAAGAIALDALWGWVSPKLTFIPAKLQTGWGGTAVKTVAAIGVTLGLSRVVPASMRKVVYIGGVGATIATLGTALKGAAISAGVPGVSGYVDYQSYALPGARMGGYIPMGGYMPRQLGSLGDEMFSPAAVIQPPGVAVPRQFGSYIAVQPHMMGGGGLSDYNWMNDGM